MTVLFNRAGSLIVGYPRQFEELAFLGIPIDSTIHEDETFTAENSTGLDLSAFDYEFNIEKTLEWTPNKCEIKVYNLSKSTQKKLSGAQKLSVQFSAGYKEDATQKNSGAPKGITQLYFGEVTAAWTEVKGEDCYTCLESGASSTEMRTSRLNLSYGPKVPITQAVQAIAQALKIGPGNLSSLSDKLVKKGLTTLNGSALSGNAARRLTDLCRSAGLEWSVQDGVLQILNIGESLNTEQSILISGTAGLIGSPKVDTTGLLTGDTLLIPNLRPGVLLNLDSIAFKGGYRVEKCTYTGSTWGQDWTCHFEARKY